MESRGADGLSHDLQTQRDFLATGVPVYGRLLDELDHALTAGLAESLDQVWSDRSFNTFYERPLLLLAALRYDALIEGVTHPLYNAIVAEPPSRDALSLPLVLESTAASRKRFRSAVANRRVQTNETSRAVAWLWPAHLIALQDPARDLGLVDLGASAGLNLVADDLPFLWTDEEGKPLELRPLPSLKLRLGLDLEPLDVHDPDSARWLTACVWPGQRERLQRLEHAITAFRSRSGKGDAPQIEQCPISASPDRLSKLPIDMRILVMQSIVRDYLPTADRTIHRDSMLDWVRSRPPSNAIWIEFEVEGDLKEPGRSVAVTAHLTRADGQLLKATLARCHPHPRKLWIDSAQVQHFVSAFD